MLTETQLDLDFSSPPSTSFIGRESIVDADSPSGKTSPVLSPATKAETLQQWLSGWQVWTTFPFPSKGGAPKAWHWETTDSSNGQLWTRNGSEWRSAAVACSLSSTLETGPVDPRFFLSPRACAGILRRAEKRGKKLPRQLEQALQTVAQNTNATGLGIGEEVSATLDQAQPCAVAFQSKASATQSMNPSLVAPTLDKCKSNGIAVLQPHTVAFSSMPMNSGKDYKARETNVAQPLMAGGPVGGNQGGDVIACFKGGQGAGAVAFDAVAQPLRSNGYNNSDPGMEARMHIMQDMQVRRLTPKECERLQGFPDGYTNIPWRKQPTAPDGPRYKALGNSMAVPVMHWIGERLTGATQ